MKEIQKMTDETERLINGPGGIMEMKQTIADKEQEIFRLQEKCNRLIMMLRRLDPQTFPDIYFIHAGIGEKDHNGMPEELLVVPAYGVDFSYVYKRTDKTTGPEW